MVLFFEFACVFLIIQIGQVESSTERQLQQDIIEVQLGKNATLKFTGHIPMEGYFLSQWKIRGPYKTTQCEKSQSELFNSRRQYIQKCVVENNSSLTVIVSEFKYYHVGKWSVSREYRRNGYRNIISTETSFDVRGFEYDNPYHGKSFKMKDGENFVMLFEKKSLKYSICRLVEEETNTVYELNTESHMNLISKAHIQWLDPCGFRMHLGNTSHGNWSLIGRYGWIEKRANFQIFIDSSIIRPLLETKSSLEFDGYFGNFEGFYGVSQLFRKPGDYHVLETPDGNVIRVSGASIMISSLTSSPNGIWIFRKLEENQSILQELHVSMTVLDLPRISHKLKRGEDGLYNLYVKVAPDCSNMFELKSKDGKIFQGTQDGNSYECSIHKDINCVFDCETLCGEQRNIVFENLELSDDSIREKMEVSFYCNDFYTNAFIIVDPHVSPESIGYPSHLWHSVQKRKYATHHEKLEVKCIASAPLSNCTLKSPTNETYIPGYHSLITSKNCSGIGRICGCIAIIENVTDIHTGNWICNMIFEDGLKVESLVPVQVLESYLIPEIEIKSREIADSSLHCELPPMYAYKKIKSCEWFGPDGVRVNGKNWEKYLTLENEDRCSLAFLGSGKKHSGLWKCIARLDGYPEEEIFATLNVSKQLFEDIQPRPRNENWPTLISGIETILEDEGPIHYEMRTFIVENTESRFCTVGNQDNEFFDASRMVDDKYPGWNFPVIILIEAEDVVTYKWEVYLENQKGILALGPVSLENFHDLIHFWHDLPKMSVLKRGSRFENKYPTNERLQSCILRSPNGVKYIDQKTHSDEDIRVGIDRERFSCWIIIMPQYLTKEHSGNWFLEMKTESGLESRNRLPIQVVESYIVLEAEQGMYLNGTIKLHCRRRTIMYDVRIRNCKWFQPDGRQISTNESMNYNTIEEYDVCTLELVEPRDTDFGTWKCSAGVDGYSDGEIAILNLSQIFITPNKHYMKQEIGMDDESDKESTKLHMTIGDAAELICTASISNFRDKIDWHFIDSVEFMPPGRIRINELPKTTTHYRSMLSINPTKKSDNRSFICSTTLRGNHVDTINISTSFAIKFRDVAPIFVDTNMNKTKWKYYVNITNPENIILKCYADGLPEPEIVWKRDGLIINDNSQPLTEFCNATFSNQSQELHIHAVNVKCSGIYLCQAKNHIGEEEIHQTIEIEQQNNSTINTPIERSSEYPSITIFIVFIFILICLSIMACYSLSERMRLKRKMIEVETALGLNETRLGPLNPEGMLHEQADFLPYDEKRWEYPEENLEIGEELGRGFFGVIMKAKASKKIFDQGSHIVAVKKLDQSDVLYSNDFRTLNIELRILANLEKHPNVVNLLGACTKKAAIGHLMVILEYCPLGNLLEYLRQNSSSFIDQIDPLSRTIDFSKENSCGIRQIHFGPGTSEESSKDDTTVMNTNIEINLRNKLSNGIEREIHSKNNDYADLSHSPIRSTIDTNLYTPAFWGNVADENDKFISTHHLLTWAYQTACAMEYLSSKKILHGDLAARNILLTEQRVAKICDFGLARTIPEGKYYRKMDAMMPLKWMAIESIEKRKYSTQSDVWSFGIVFWEIFTLGEHPYAGLNANKLIAFLCSGQRLEMPIYATEGIYKIMLHCWNKVPEDRPSFRELVHDINEILNQSKKAFITI